MSASSNSRDLTDPEECLRTVRRATLGRWWLQVKPVAVDDGYGFQAQAHTMRGEPGLWAGEVRATLAEATGDAVEAVAFLRAHG